MYHGVPYVLLVFKVHFICRPRAFVSVLPLPWSLLPASGISKKEE